VRKEKYSTLSMAKAQAVEAIIRCQYTYCVWREEDFHNWIGESMSKFWDGTTTLEFIASGRATSSGDILLMN